MVIRINDCSVGGNVGGRTQNGLDSVAINLDKTWVNLETHD